MTTVARKIPVNVITGFLGVGKTTAILQLLANKPAEEKWAVLVNEFGEIGIDGAIIEDSGVAIKEVMGGCFCCTNGGSVESGLSMLLMTQRPDRVLIEPTGLGHVRRILRTIKSRYFEEVIEVRATLALLDPRHLADERYMNNGLYRDQLAVADVIVGNKADLCDDGQKATFENYLQGFENSKAATGWVQRGDINLEWLDLPSSERQAFSHHSHEHLQHNHSHDHDHGKQAEPIKAQLSEGERFLRKENNGSGYSSCGWLFNGDELFRMEPLQLIFKSLKGERVKGVLNTDEGAIRINGVDGDYDIQTLNNPTVDSRLEVIHLEPMRWNTIERALLQATLAGAVE